MRPKEPQTTLFPDAMDRNGDPDETREQAPASDPIEPAEPSLVTRYRLQLVAEEQTSYDAEGMGTRLTRPEAVAAFLRPRICDRPQEQMAVVYLDVRNRVVAWSVPFRGTLNRCSVEPRPFLQTGLLLGNAAGMVIAHNHPSGDPSPSPEDLAFTRRLAEAGDLVGLRLVDHLILGEGSRWVSLRQRGAL